MRKNKTVFKCHGSKHYLSPWIISNFPENYKEMIYLEPFCGNANVLLNKKKSTIEIINDIDLSIIEVYQAIRDEPKELIKRLKRCKYCEETFNEAVEKNEKEDYLDQAVNEFIVRRMSRGGTKNTFARLREGEESNSWSSSIENLSDLSKRIKEVYIFNKPAVEIMKVFNFSDVFLYCDPPYLHETKISKTVYESEMDTNDHIELAHSLNAFQGKALISGYASPLYNRLYKEWNIEKKKIASSKETKVEILWKNY